MVTRRSAEEEGPISHNTWIHRIARRAVRPLAGTGITPNHLTAARLGGGLAAAAAFAVGTPGWNDVGAALFLISMLLDRADGELARLTRQTSSRGHRFDLIADGVSNAAALVGIGIGLRDSVLAPWSPALGVLAGAAVAAVLWLVTRIEEIEGERAAELGNFMGFDPDDAMLVVPLAMFLGQGVALLVAAAVGAPAFTLFFFWLFRHDLAAVRRARGRGGGRA